MSTSSAAALKGQRIGRYTLVEHLCSGGMAEIFLARHEAPGGFSKDLVLKILQPRYADHPAVAEMFRAEARLAAMLQHPNIVDVYDVGEEGGMSFIAMEHIQGHTLTDVVRRAIEASRPLPLEHAAYVVAETAAGLAYMHDGLDGAGQRFGIVHRDISPSNLVIALSGQTKIIDFGIARQSEGDDVEGARPGKVSYMSPEQVRGRPLDGRSDIFSLGTILYEMTLGRRLWRGPKEIVMRRIVEEKPPPPTYIRRDYPPALEVVVLRALEKRPEDRYAHASDMFEDLERYLAVAPVRVHNHQIARYLQELFAADVEISELGLRRARAYDEGDEDPDVLDFDRPRAGAGRALAEALRASPSPAATPTPAPLSPVSPVVTPRPAAVTEPVPEGKPPRGSRGRWMVGLGLLLAVAAAVAILALARS